MLDDFVRVKNEGMCPVCGSGNILVRATRKPKRYYQCRKCKKNWYGVEFFYTRRDACSRSVKENLKIPDL